MPHSGSILQAGTCLIFSFAENPRLSQVWQLLIQDNILLARVCSLTKPLFLTSTPQSIKEIHNYGYFNLDQKNKKSDIIFSERYLPDRDQ